MRMLADMERRMLNWANWVWMTHSGGRVAGGGELQERVDNGAGWDAALPIPSNEEEAQETQAGVMTLPSELRAAVECWYLGSGGAAQKCRRLCVSETTLRERIGLAHRRLGQWLSDKKALAREHGERERKRIEAQRGARAGG